MTYTIIAARYGGESEFERDICVTLEDEDGWWTDCWYSGVNAPPEAIVLADEDEAVMSAAVAALAARAAMAG